MTLLLRCHVWETLMQSTDPEEEIQRILDGAKREGFLSPRQVDGQVVELLSLGHHLPTAVLGGNYTLLLLQCHKEQLTD